MFGRNLLCHLLLLLLFHFTTATKHTTWYGQQLQDRIIIEEIYQHQLRHQGYFVELGVADGIMISNTLALERHHGWRGLCIEPSLAYAKLVTSKRTCIKRGDVVSGRSGEIVKFMDQADDQGKNNERTEGGALNAPASVEGLYSGILDNMTTYNVGGSVTKHVTRTLSELLDESHAPTHVDFLSLDTEGSEYDILSTFPYESRSFGAILVEHNHENIKRRQIRLLLESKGYVRVRCIETDDLYVSLTVLSHYKIRVDPRECISISVRILCTARLNSMEGREECVTSGGSFVKYLPVPLWLEKEVETFKARPGKVCEQLLAVCDKRNGFDMVENKGNEHSFVVPLVKGVGPSLNLVLDNEHYFHHFVTSITTSNASVSIGMDQICRDQSISEDKCMNMATETELFVDQYLVNETKVAVKRVMQNMFAVEGMDEGDGGQVRDYQAPGLVQL